MRRTFGGRSVVPNAAVFIWERIPFDADGEIEDALAFHPDWTVEILSPDQKTTKIIRHVLHCLKHGSQLGWLIDPEERVILVFLLGQLPTELTGSDLLPVLPNLELNLTVDHVFAWLKSGNRSG